MREDPQDPNEPGDEECMIFSADGGTRLLFVEVPEAKQIKNRLHFDLRPTDATRDEAIVSSAIRTLTSLPEASVLRRLRHLLDQRV